MQKSSIIITLVSVAIATLFVINMINVVTVLSKAKPRAELKTKRIDDETMAAIEERRQINSLTKKTTEDLTTIINYVDGK